ncbi:MAG: ABC transporter C-terminal domain-containing protein [Anaerolineales bacterium]|nr:ABC transporter C-terminal domain-containing protein [Anaerolineales bacterium]
MPSDTILLGGELALYGTDGRRLSAGERAAIEARFEELKAALLTDTLQASGSDHKRARELSEEHAYLQRELEELMVRWESLSTDG